MTKEQEDTCQKALDMVLKKEFPQDLYMIGGYKEDVICLEKRNGEWSVYFGCNNTCEDLSVYHTVVEACIDVMNRLCAEDTELCWTLREEFMELIIKKSP